MSQKFILTLLITAFMGMFVIQPDLLALDEAASLICEDGTVSIGDSEDSVRDKCGDPQKVSQRDIDSPIIWFYNFGPSEFVYYVTFTNGIVERIQMDGYGD
jgi:hypothetical protein